MTGDFNARHLKQFGFVMAGKACIVESVSVEAAAAAGDAAAAEPLLPAPPAGHTVGLKKGTQKGTQRGTKKGETFRDFSPREKCCFSSTSSHPPPIPAPPGSVAQDRGGRLF